MTFLSHHVAAALFGSLLVAASALASDSTTAVPDNCQPVMLVHSKLDTVLLIRDGDVQSVLSNIGEKIDMTRRRGYGGAGGPAPGLMLLDMGPIQDIVSSSRSLKNKNIDVPRFLLTTCTGGMGYGGIGNGIRIGGGGYSGQYQYISEYSNKGTDSVAIIDVSFDFGGFLLEKCIIQQKNNYIVGGMIGGGTYKLNSKIEQADLMDAFTPLDAELPDHAIPGVNLSIYGGMTRSIISWFHIGGDLMLTGFMGFPKEYTKYTTGRSNFYSLSPSVRIRIMFGNLG